ncbi:hypothetical protein BX616_002584, partial [Lobosporangium transversale]
ASSQNVKFGPERESVRASHICLSARACALELRPQAGDEPTAKPFDRIGAYNKPAFTVIVVASSK